MEKDSERFLKYQQSSVKDFQHSFYEYIKDEVPKILKNENSWEVGSILNPNISINLIKNVGWWIFKKDLDEVLKEMEQQPQNICGKVFRPGEPVYSCRECSMDPTCVLCQSCFKNSPHKNHLYKLHTSEGGGCCDCGDEEAWHNSPACSLHDQSTSSDKSASNLSKESEERAIVFFRTLMKFIAIILTFKDVKEVLEKEIGVQIEEEPDKFATVLYNDESHTFDYVIAILQKAIKCDHTKAAGIATVVDREGRSVICMDNKEVCDKARNVIQQGTVPNQLMINRRATPLQTRVTSTWLLAYEEFVNLLLTRLSKVIQQSADLRDIFSKIALQDYIEYSNDDNDVKVMSFAKIMMLNDAKLWITPRTLYQQVLMNSLLLNPDTKKQFGVLFSQLYTHIMLEFMLDDHSHSQSISSMSVQLFTAPSLAQALVAEEDIISIILKIVIELSTDTTEETHDNAGDEWCRVLKLNGDNLRKNLRRMQYCFFDLKYIVANKPTVYTKELRDGFHKGFQTFLRLLMALQGMDPVIRKTDRHVVQEPEWETGITMAMRMVRIIFHMLEWCYGDKELLSLCLKDCLVSLAFLKQSNQDLLSVFPVFYIKRDFPCIDYDIQTKSVSVHSPVPRLTAALFVQFSKYGMTWLQKVEILKQNVSCLELLEHSLRCLCLSAQVQVGMWRRNGFALINQTFYYKENRLRSEAFDRDLQMIQLCAANMDPDHFLTCVLHKMNLTPPAEMPFEYRVPLIKETIHLLISMCCERFIPGIAEVDMKDHIRREIIHVLAGGPKPHSKIAKQLSDIITEKCDWESVLEDIADFKKARNVTDAGKYELKDACLGEFCPFYYHYNASGEDTTAQNYILERRKKLNLIPVFVPPKLPRFKPMFTNVPFVLCCDSMLELFRSAMSLINPEEPESWSDKFVDMMIYLINMAIVEEKQQKEFDAESAYNFTQKFADGDEDSVLNILRKLSGHECVAIHKEALNHVISEIEGLTNQQSDKKVDQNKHEKEKEQVRLERKRKAQERREKLLNQMKSQQKNFLKQNPDLLSSPGKTGTEEEEEENKDDENDSMIVEEPAPISSDITQQPTCMSLAWQKIYMKTEQVEMCILCQEESDIITNSMVMPAYVQRTMMYSKVPIEKRIDEPVDHFLTDLSLPHSTHVSTCNHTMHYKCFLQYYAPIKARGQRGSARRFNPLSFNIDKNEFLCPLCSRLSNTVLPMIAQAVAARHRGIMFPPEEGSAVDVVNSNEIPLDVWLKEIKDIITIEERSEEKEKRKLEMNLEVDVSEEDKDADGEGSGSKRRRPSEEDEESNPVVAHEFENNAYRIVHKNDIPINPPPKKLLEEVPENTQVATSSFAKVVVESLPMFSDICEQQALWLAVSTGIIAFENLNRLENRPKLTDGPIRIFAAQHYLQRLLSIQQYMYVNPEEIPMNKSNLVALKSLLLVTKSEKECLINSNIFATYVQLWFSGQALRNGCRTSKNPFYIQHVVSYDKHVLHLCTLAQLVQIVLFMDFDSLLEADETMETESDSKPSDLYNVCRQIYSHAYPKELPTTVSRKRIEDTVSSCMLVFLRWCALFLHHDTNIPPPEVTEDAKMIPALLNYLDLPKTLAGLLDADGRLSLDPIVQKWCKFPDLQNRLKDLPKHLMYPKILDVPDFVELPHDYSDLLGEAADFTCPKFNSENMLSPTMCLICGKVLCSQNYCCQREHNSKQIGACNYHSITCGAEKGVFLRIRDCSCVLLCSLDRGTTLAAPYLDQYGEADKGLRRGNPLRLSKPQLRELRKVWLSHSIPERISADIEKRQINHWHDWAHL